jgi:hypothetical protein
MEVNNMRKFTINCNFGGTKSPFTVYIGMPEKVHHPLHFQADWLSKERGGNIPQEVMDSLQKLLEISIKNNVPFEDLCAYAIESAQITEAPTQKPAQLTETSQPAQLESKPEQVDTKPSQPDKTEPA